MAHVAKYAKSSVGQLCQHYERKDGVKFGNIDIDPERSHLNYNLAPKRNQIEFIQQRTEKLKCLKRADVKVMCSWVLTAPKELDKSEHDKFFKESYEFLEKRYGKSNVISSYVHKDETTDHMHFAFVPVKYDRENKRHKVSAKEVITRVELKRFHGDLDKHLTKAFGRDIGVLNDATKEGNKTIKELKADKRRLNDLRADIQTALGKANADPESKVRTKLAQAERILKKWDKGFKRIDKFFKENNLQDDYAEFLKKEKSLERKQVRNQGLEM